MSRYRLFRCPSRRRRPERLADRHQLGGRDALQSHATIGETLRRLGSRPSEPVGKVVAHLGAMDGRMVISNGDGDVEIWQVLWQIWI